MTYIYPLPHKDYKFRYDPRRIEREDGALETVCIDLPMYAEDQISPAPLIEFIGQTNYNYIFETPI